MYVYIIYVYTYAWNISTSTWIINHLYDSWEAPHEKRPGHTSPLRLEKRHVIACDQVTRDSRPDKQLQFATENGN